MYFETIQQFNKVLGNLEKILDKAVLHAERKNFDVNNFVGLRLSPDMFPLSRQIQIATDAAKTAASSLAGKEAPKFDDNETTIAQLRERISKTRTLLASFKASDYVGAGERVIKMSNPAGKGMKAEDALLQRAVPNFYFHVMTTYALLRMGGVDIGKKDYLGDLPMFDV
ncbi:MAG: DUF1993 domain-containing protein [Proteobacteria bacterium]|nr:DUF1993 domain-containing protein [Pseudomonadota bacterium]